MNFFNKSITKRILGILLSATVVCSAMYGCSGGTSNDESSAKEAVASATSKPPVSSKVDKVESSKPVLSKPESSAEESSAEESSESSNTETSIGYIETDEIDISSYANSEVEENIPQEIEKEPENSSQDKNNESDLE